MPAWINASLIIRRTGAALEGDQRFRATAALLPVASLALLTRGPPGRSIHFSVDRELEGQR